jgi:hypothetical protein
MAQGAWQVDYRSLPGGEVACSCGKPTLELFLIGVGRLSGFRHIRQQSAMTCRSMCNRKSEGYRRLNGGFTASKLGCSLARLGK